MILSCSSRSALNAAGVTAAATTKPGPRTEKYFVKSWRVFCRDSAVAGEAHLCRREKNPRRENYKNTNHDNETHSNGDSCGHRNNMGNRWGEHGGGGYCDH